MTSPNHPQTRRKSVTHLPGLYLVSGHDFGRALIQKQAFFRGLQVMPLHFSMPEASFFHWW